MTGEVDPYDDPFAEDIHDPVVFALNGTALLWERAQTVRQKALAAERFGRIGANVVAIAAIRGVRPILDRLSTEALEARVHAGHLRAEKDSDQAYETWQQAYSRAQRTLAEAERLANHALRPDSGLASPPQTPLPAVQDWSTVSSQVQADVSSWAANVRGKKGKMLIAMPSPGTGKTLAMISTAVREQSARQRVVIAVRTKQMLVDELEPRVRKQGAFIRLHVIQGRDESTCWNYDNVKAVQEHGYAPGSAVCSRCEYHPDVAKKLRRFTVCPYYRSRQNAQNDTAAARFKLNDYPLILTTHAGYLTALESGGGRFGKFWPSDLLMIDEDPTEAFEPEVIVGPEHLDLPTPPRPEDRAAHAMAALLLGAMDQAEVERRAMAGQGYKANGIDSSIHSKFGSAYAGQALHALLDRVVTGPVGQRRGFRHVTQVLRDVSDSHVHPASGSLHGATTAHAVSLVVPPRGLAQLGNALFEENALRMRLRRAAYKKLYGQEMSPTSTIAQVTAALADSDTFDSVYRVRLEYVLSEGKREGRWRFVLQNFVSMLDQGTNLIVGDAYAHEEHYRQLFDKPRTNPSDPTWVDPVTVINHVAKFPEGSIVARVRTRANITYLRDEGWKDHAALISEIFRQLAGQRVLVYGHKALKDRVEKLFLDNDSFGIAEWAFENWGGGRGKDHYGDFDAVVTISDYVQNVGGMLHKVNARAARDTDRLFTRNDIDAALDEGTRISVDMKRADVAHKMSDREQHWRMQQEHERQNVNEQAQALHRVRGLRSAKRMIVVGDGIPFTKDTIAASVVANPSEGPRGRKKLRSTYTDGYLTVEETVEAVKGVADHFGCWSPAFLHAFFTLELGDLLGVLPQGCEPQLVAQDDLYEDLSHRDHPKLATEVATSHLDPTLHPEKMSGAKPRFAPPMTLLQRVWFPPADWLNLCRVANQQLWRTKLASAEIAKAFPHTGTHRPSWVSGTHPGFRWYSRHEFQVGFRAFVNIIENQYGIERDGKLVAPNQKPFVPF